MTLPGRVGVPSGSGEPLEMRAARVRAKRERPQPGMASSRVRWPKGMRPGQSQSRGLPGTSERKSPAGEEAGELADGAGVAGKARECSRLWTKRSLSGSKVMDKVLSGWLSLYERGVLMVGQ